MDTKSIYLRYIGAIAESTAMEDGDFGAVRFMLRMAINDVAEIHNADCANLTGQLDATKEALVIAREGIAIQESQIITLQTREDRLSAWLGEHYPAVDLAAFDYDVASAIIASVASEPVAPMATIKLNGNGGNTSVATNGTIHNATALQATPENSTPTRSRAFRFEGTSEELLKATVERLQLLNRKLDRTPSLAEFDAGDHGLPTAAGIASKLGCKWRDIVLAAGLTPNEKRAKEATADAAATFR